jgi:hypothetical protein
MRGQMLPMQVINELIKRIERFGRLAVPCPVQPGHYYLKNAFIDETQMPLYRILREGPVVIMEVIVNQKISGKMTKIFDLQSHFTCNKSNWPA